MTRKHTHYMVDAYRQAGPSSQPVLIESGRVVAHGDDEAIREAGVFRVQFDPTYIVVREVSRKGSRIVHKSEPVFK